MATLFDQRQPDLFGDHEIVRWYLKETALATIDTAESAKEDAAAKKIGAFIARTLEMHPADEGIHYSDIFEHYVYTVKDKPRRLLADWLLDYFYKTPEGTYRLPASKDEEELKTQVRSSGTNRRIKRFVTYLQQGVSIPSHEQPGDATLTDWIRQCKRSGMYEAGKLLFERGGLVLDNLSDEQAVEVEEDYQVCARMLSRSVATSSDRPKKGKRSTPSQANLDL